MIDEQYIDLVTAYLEGNLSPEQRAELNELIERGTIDILDIKEMEMYYQRLDKLSAAEPGPELGERFYTMLEEEKMRQSPSLPTIVSSWMERLREVVSMRRVAFALGIFIAGMLIGNWATPFQNYHGQVQRLSEEVSYMREVMMLSLLDDNSPTERLKAVNISADIRTADDRVIEALLKTLNNDSNVNVRLAAIEALLQHASNPQVREGLVDAITRQESPLVQVALADAMLALQERGSIQELRKLLDREELDSNVRYKLEHAIAALS